MSGEDKKETGNVEFSEMQLDAVGEILNISMGSAATAVSSLLDAKVWITTPRVAVKKVYELNYQDLEPAICVRIVYISGISGSNLMVLKQNDVQLILNQLMGLPLVVSDDFEFDELNISAVSEVMNQMMGASATALSDFLGVMVDISTPTSYILETANFGEISQMDLQETVVSVNFDLTIDGIIKSEFMSVISIDLAMSLADKMLGGYEDFAEPAPAATPSPTPAPASPSANMQQPSNFAGQPMQQTMGIPPQMQQPMQQPMQQAVAMPGYDPNAAYMNPMQNPAYPYPAPGQMPYDPNMAGMYPPPYAGGYPPPYGYPGYPPQNQNAGNFKNPVNIKNAQLHQFDSFDSINLSAEQQDNLQLLMGVPLQITVEIGSTKRKVKDILEFTQGTIIELERQAGAPVDVIVNGNLIARGDVVVIDDNFAVRITEIIKSKFLDTLGNKE